MYSKEWSLAGDGYKCGTNNSVSAVETFNFWL